MTETMVIIASATKIVLESTIAEVKMARLGDAEKGVASGSLSRQWGRECIGSRLE